MKTILPKLKTVSKSAIEAVSVWKALDLETSELVSYGFVLFRKATSKEPGRKLIAINKYKARLSTEADGAGKFFLGEDEIDVEQSKKYQDILETLIALP